MLDRIRDFALNNLVADVPLLSPGERWRSALGALLGLALTAALVAVLPSAGLDRFLLAPMGASAVILFALPLSPLAQPWSVLGGYLMATLSALLCAWLLPHEVLGAALAVGLTIWLSARLRCLHPPSGALAILIVFDHHRQPEHSAELIALASTNVVCIVLAALLVNKLILRRSYPHCRVSAQVAAQAVEARPAVSVGLAHPDLAAALQKVDSFLDIQDKDLLGIYRDAVEHAFVRHHGLRCADVMRRDVPVLEFASELQESWNQLRDGRCATLPVLDRFNKRLLGVVTANDFLRQIDATTVISLPGQIRRLLRRTTDVASEKPEVVGQIMKPNPLFVAAETPLAELVERLIGTGVSEVPVVDERQRYLGMILQADLIAALYQRSALQCGLVTTDGESPGCA